MHDDEGGARGGDDRDHRGVGEAAADVVDQDGARGEGLFGDGGAHGVDGDGDAFGGEAAHHGDDAFEFLGLVHAGGARAGRLAADVHQVGALGDQVEAALDGRRGVEEAAAVGEGVRGDVHDSHDRAPVPLRKARDAPASALLAHTASVGPEGGRTALRAGWKRPGPAGDRGPRDPARAGPPRGRRGARSGRAGRSGRPDIPFRQPVGAGRGRGRTAAQEARQRDGQVDEALGLHGGEADAGEVA